MFIKQWWVLWFYLKPVKRFESLSFLWKYHIDFTWPFQRPLTDWNKRWRVQNICYYFFWKQNDAICHNTNQRFSLATLVYCFVPPWNLWNHHKENFYINTTYHLINPSNNYPKSHSNITDAEFRAINIIENCYFFSNNEAW